MALSQRTQFGLATALFGVLSFVLAVVAELKKPKIDEAHFDLRQPPYGTPITGSNAVMCRFPAIVAVFFPYGGRRVPRKALFGYTPLYVFFHVDVGVTVAGLGMTVWLTVSEAAHLVRNVHRDPGYACPTAKTGVLGGAAFLNLDAMLIWLVCLMLADKVREDYFDDDGDGDGGDAEGSAGIEEK